MTTDIEIVSTPQAAVIPHDDSMSPAMRMVMTAVANNAPIETVERLIALQERMEANEARKAFVAAMAEFKAALPRIEKNKKVGFESRNKDNSIQYWHATLDNVCSIVDPLLSQVGLSYRWVTEQVDGGKICVTCVVRHALGHSEENSLQAGADNSGTKNAIQAVGSTVSYLERYTLLAALGLATSDQDDDGHNSSAGLKINDIQLQELQEALAEVNADVGAFCGLMGVSCLADILNKDLPGAYRAIDKKRSKMKMEDS